MDHKTTLTLHVNASPDKVWAVISDIPGCAATLSGVESVQMLSDVADVADIAAKAESL